MTRSQLFAGAASLLALCACFPSRSLEVETISLDHLTAAQATELARPYLSKDGTLFHSDEVLNAITVRDHSRNVSRIRSMLSSRDESPASVALRFQLIRATEAGGVEAGLEHLADALGELLRFKGYALMSEAVVSASERGMVEQSLDGGGVPMQLGVRINDVRGYGDDGSVELQVELRRNGGQMLSTNVVVPVGQTVVLGSAYPGGNGGALILTVRGELGSQELRSASEHRWRSGEHTRGEAVEAAAEVEAAAAAEAMSVDVARQEIVVDVPVVATTKTRVMMKHPGPANSGGDHAVVVPGRAVPARTVVVPPPR